MITLLPSSLLTKDILKQRGDLLLVFPGYGDIRKTIIEALLDLMHMHKPLIKVYVLAHTDQKQLMQYKIDMLPAMIHFIDGKENGRFDGGNIRIEMKRLLTGLRSVGRVDQ